MSDGFLVVDKPAGITSHDVVARLRRQLGTRRVGHAGTLDPMATGVLVVGVGMATRLLRFVESTRKRYEAEVTFGARTDSLDVTGEVIETADASHVTEARVRDAVAGFVGELEQIPPMVSAIKVDGERLHAKARRGETIERTPRRITIHELTVLDFEPGEQPRATLDVVCSAGTYVRTLADDLGVALGTLAHLSMLRRTAVGEATVAEAIALDAATPELVSGARAALSHLPVRALDAADADAIRHGRRIPSAGIDGPYLAVHDDLLVAVLRDEADGTRIEVGLPSPLR